MRSASIANGHGRDAVYAVDAKGQAAGRDSRTHSATAIFSSRALDQPVSPHIAVAIARRKSNPPCTIFYTGGPVAGDANWATFVAAYPTWSVSSSVPFIIADDPGLWTVDNVHLGPTATSGKGQEG